jgi:hypothetical protein
MIRPPRRSVTRFFIPMIDVLTLLFCIFLLMPFVKSAGEGEGIGDATTPKVEAPPGDAKELAKKVDQLQIELDRVKKERAETIEKLLIRTLEIGKDDGRLYYLTGSGRDEVRSPEEATSLIESHRKDARRQAGRELYYLFLYPRSPSPFPTEEQITRYQKWFHGVPHGFDNPRAQD